MKKEIILDLAKILGCGFAMFVALFAFDMWGQWLGFLMHLIPSFIIIIMLAIAWNKQLIGGILFILFGVVSIFYFHTYKVLMIFSIISLPLFIIGLLFMIYNNIKEK